MTSRHLNKSRSLCRVTVVIGLTFSIYAAFFSVPTRADTPAQVGQAIQAVCNRATASFGKRDLSGFIAMYSPALTVRSVPGHVTDFRQTQVGFANAFANPHYRGTAHGTVLQVVPQGNHARAVLRWHYVSRYTGSLPSQNFMIVRDYEEQSLWEKSSRGWVETVSNISHDVLDYRR